MSSTHNDTDITKEEIGKCNPAGAHYERIGVLGGSFNPIHNGHINMARAFIRQLGLDRVLLIPVWSPPHKSAQNMLAASTRLEMCSLACRNVERIEVSAIEIERGGTSYTVETLRELTQSYPAARFYLIMGADMFLTLDKWRNFTEIARLTELCACPRNAGELAALEKCARRLESVYGALCHVGDFPVTQVSSTQVRELLQNGGGASDLIPEQVLNYIKKNNLYAKRPT